MTEVNTIVGRPIENMEGMIAIPISKVKMTFASGGTDFNTTKDQTPFGGGTGGSVTITPVAFLTMGDGNIKIMHMQHDTHIIEQVIEKVPEAINEMMNAKRINSAP